MVLLRDSNFYHQIFDHIFLHLNKHLKDIPVLCKEQEYLSNVCSDEEKYDQRFDDKNWNHEGVPYLQNAQSNIFCKIDKLTSYHTHTVVIGTVLDSMFKDNIATLTYVDGKYE